MVLSRIRSRESQHLLFKVPTLKLVPSENGGPRDIPKTGEWEWEWGGGSNSLDGVPGKWSGPLTALLQQAIPCEWLL